MSSSVVFQGKVRSPASTRQEARLSTSTVPSFKARSQASAHEVPTSRPMVWVNTKVTLSVTEVTTCSSVLIPWCVIIMIMKVQLTAVL